MRAVLLARATAANLPGLRAMSRASQGCLSGRVRACLRDGMRSHDQDAPQIAVALLGDGTQALLATARVVARNQADEGGQIAPRLERLGIGDGCGKCCRPDDADAGDGLQPSAGRALAVLGMQALVG